MICLIDYGAGNLFSVQKAVEFLGYKPRISNRVADLDKADKIIFPGVGSFGRAVENLRRTALGPKIKEVVDAGTPFLGICLGLQLFFAYSEESPDVRGLDLVAGRVKKFQNGLKIPHLGWNSVSQRKTQSQLWHEIPEQVYCYFAHSYYIEPEDPNLIIATCDYGGDYPVAIQRNNLFGLQFHPEKSQKWGLQILHNFLKL
jgi:imidazole glycerol-phosphate synthase subunit HisH